MTTSEPRIRLPRFSRLHTAQPTPNRLARALLEHQGGGRPLLDLTLSNPVQADIDLPLQILAPCWSKGLKAPYDPDPRGLLEARTAVAKYYRDRNRSVQPEQILLTASTSESYSFCFQLFADPGDEVLIPSPSYPLLEDLCRLAHLRSRRYRLQQTDEGWKMPDEFLLGNETRILLLVDPNNPTGSIVGKRVWAELEQLCSKERLLLLCDEVFSDYVFETPAEASMGNEPRPPRITLNGISKVAGLPQLKLGWILVEGPPAFVQATMTRLEVISDNYLSVNTPVQVSLPEILRNRGLFETPIRKRLEDNRLFSVEFLRDSSAQFLSPEAGWSAVIRLPRFWSDEEWALKLLTGSDVLVHPGYLFGFEEEGCVVVSLLTPTATFREGLRRLNEFVHAHDS